MEKHRTLFVTQRAPRHQQAAIGAAPADLEIVMRYMPAREDILALLPTVEFFISERAGTIDAEMIRAGSKLRLIQRLGSQIHDVDLAAAKQAGIPVCFWPIHNCNMVAEHTLMLMLALARRLCEVTEVTREAGDWGIEPRKCDENTFAYNWSGRRGIRALGGATVGILGMGEIGTELARRLRGMNCTVLYNKRTPLPPATEAELGVRYGTVADLQAESDFLCVLLPHSAETAEMINAAFLAGVKPGALLVSTGTSTALNEVDVAEAVRSGRLGGLATDGYAWEPIRADNPLLPLARDPRCNVILTPHVAGGDLSAHKDVRVKEYSNLVRLLRGEPLLYRLV
jgi:lactate dehydrogenase-like 2-hydroxyacid dehydrogenase